MPMHATISFFLNQADVLDFADVFFSFTAVTSVCAALEIIIIYCVTLNLVTFRKKEEPQIKFPIKLKKNIDPSSYLWSKHY